MKYRLFFFVKKVSSATKAFSLHENFLEEKKFVRKSFCRRGLEKVFTRKKGIFNRSKLFHYNGSFVSNFKNEVTH